MEEATLVQQAYAAVVEKLVKTGRVPHYTELAATLGLPPEEAKQFFLAFFSGRRNRLGGHRPKLVFQHTKNSF